MPTLLRKIYYSLKGEMQLLHTHNVEEKISLKRIETSCGALPIKSSINVGPLLNPDFNSNDENPIKFPCDTMKDFDELEKKLKDKSYFDAMVRVISQKIIQF